MLHRKAWSRQFCHICTAKYNLCPSVDLKAISFPIYPQLFCELFTNQYLMINDLGHAMQIQRDPVITCKLKKTFSSTLSLVVKNSNRRQRQYCDVVKTSPSNNTDGIQHCDVACSRRNLYIIAVSTKPTIWWGQTHGCMWTGQRLEHCNPPILQQQQQSLAEKLRDSSVN